MCICMLCVYVCVRVLNGDLAQLARTITFRVYANGQSSKLHPRVSSERASKTRDYDIVSKPNGKHRGGGDYALP